MNLFRNPTFLLLLTLTVFPFSTVEAKSIILASGKAIKPLKNVRVSLANARPQKTSREKLLWRAYFSLFTRTSFVRGDLLHAGLVKHKAAANDFEFLLAKNLLKPRHSHIKAEKLAIIQKTCKPMAGKLKESLWKWVCGEFNAGKATPKKPLSLASLELWKKKLNTLHKKSPLASGLIRQKLFLGNLYYLSFPWSRYKSLSVEQDMKQAFQALLKSKKMSFLGRIGLTWLYLKKHYRQLNQVAHKEALKKQLKVLLSLDKQFPRTPEILEMAQVVCRRLRDDKTHGQIQALLMKRAARSHWDFSFALYGLAFTKTRPYSLRYTHLKDTLTSAISTSKRLKEPDVALFFARKLAYRMRWKFGKEALELYERHLKQQEKGPNGQAMQFFRARLLQSAKRFNEAVATYLKLWKKTKRTSLINDLVYLYQYKLKDEAKAFAFLNKVLKATPDLRVARMKRATLYRRTNQKAKAEQDFKYLLRNPSTLKQYDFGTIASFYMYSQNDMKAALQTYNLGIKTFPSYAYLHYYRANLYRKMGKTKLAQTGYLKAYRLDSNSQMFVRSYARLLVKENRGGEALRFLEAQMKKHPGTYALQSTYVETLQKLNQVTKAEAFMLKSGNTSFLLQIANRAKRSGDTKKALKYYNAYIAAMEKSNRQSYYIYSYRANLYHKMGKTAEAIADFKRGIALRPGYRYSYYKLARYFHYKLKKPAEALKVWEDYLKKKPTDSQAVLYKARILATMKNFKDAQREYERALTMMKPSVYKYNTVAHFYVYKMKQPKLALQLWNDFLEKSPKSVAAYQYRAEVYSKLRKYEEAAKDLRKAIELKPDYQYYVYKLAYLYQYKLKKIEAALQAWDDYIKRNPKKVNGYTYRARLYRGMKQYDKAMEDYQRAILVNPNNRNGYWALANFYGYYKIKQYEKVPAVWSRYLKKKPFDNYALRYRAESYAKIKKWAEALKDWEVVLKRTSSRWTRKTALKGKANALQGLGRHKEAIQLFEAQLKKATSSWTRRKLNKQLAQSYRSVGRFKEAIMALNASLYNRRYMNQQQRLMLGQLQALTGDFSGAKRNLEKLCFGRRSYRGRVAQANACSSLDFLALSFSLRNPPFLP